MAKKSKSRTSAADLHTAELKKHSRELKKHADALATHTLAMMMTTPVDAHKLVYSILSEFSATPLTDATKLSDLGFDVPALAGLAAKIRALGAPVDTGAIQACTTVGDVVTVVSRAKP